MMALIGEGRQKEGIVPLLSDASIPARFAKGRLEALLPGGRTIPISLAGMAAGGVISAGPVAPITIPQQQMPPIIIVNSMDPSDVVAAGLPSNAKIIENQVAGSIRNRGQVGKAVSRYAPR